MQHIASMVMLDYEVVQVPGEEAIDLLGFHLLHEINDWFSVGIGGRAPLFSGDYGGFMAFDLTVHAQKSLYGPIFANAGLSIGGGGGGKGIEHSKSFSGTGGFYKYYAGLGYDFTDFAVGVNYSQIAFIDAAIDNAQINVFVQIPFSISLASYGASRDPVPYRQGVGQRGALTGFGENVQTIGIEHVTQRNATGSDIESFSIVDIQFSHYFTDQAYLYLEGGIGFEGIPLYNQIFVGVGRRFPLTSRVLAYAQVAMGSGGYAPEIIDTGPGLLIYPKAAVELLVTSKVGFSLSAGYLTAPLGSSENLTVGAALHYHPHAAHRGITFGGGTDSGQFTDHRFGLFLQSVHQLEVAGYEQAHLSMLSVQYDTVIHEYWYLPVQASIAIDDYYGYPGYGEILAGIGAQSRYAPDARFQVFAHMLAGTNVFGPILKPEVGMRYALSNAMAIFTQAGRTQSILEEEFPSSSWSFALGLNYCFALP